jgi:Zn-dependent protease with chaperone function
MTNFFEQQQAARRRTAWLLFLYSVCVLLTVVVSAAATVAILSFFVQSESARTHPHAHTLTDDIGLTYAEAGGIAAGVAILQGVIVLGASWFKTSQLSSGGKAVALLLGGQELLHQTQDASARRLLNVVEEMALASGVPVPAVYVLEDEDGINAFAAGHAPGDAVIAVSRGCLKYLSRDELQGVVAHEFSHILNGDMSLNLKLIGWAFGLLALALVGQTMVRLLGESRSSSSSRDDNKKDGGGLLLALFLIGVVVWILGMIASFFGNLLKASVSRQREFLADASAVQFTRNPDGIAGALKKIGGLSSGSVVKNANAPEASHLFFATGLRFELFATHPPLEERIRRLDPRWDGTYPPVKEPHVEPEPAQRSTRSKMPFPIPGAAGPAMLAGVVDRVGKPTPEQGDHAADLLDKVPAIVRQAAGEPFGARILVYCLTLDLNPPVRERQLAALSQLAPPQDLEAVNRLLPAVDATPETYWLALLDLAIPALRRMSPGQYDPFRKHLDSLIHADSRLSPFEYLLYCVVERYLDPAFGRKPHRMPAPSAAAVKGLVAEVLAVLAWEGNATPEAVRDAYTAGMRSFLGTDAVPPLAARTDCTIEKLGKPLHQLAAMSPGDRKRMLAGCVACVVADGKVTVREVELCRAIGDTLGLPVPALQATAA